jgi:uncharacterized protein YqeY
MSNLKDQITAAMKDAMRAKDKPRLGTIRLILADLKRIEVDERIELDDERIIIVMDKMLKQRRDSISQFEAANRQELADIEKAEIVVIQSFMPVSLSNEEIEQLVTAAISNTSASSMKDMGSVMGQLRPQLQGRADMAEVSKLIKARLS